MAALMRFDSRNLILSGVLACLSGCVGTSSPFVVQTPPKAAAPSLAVERAVAERPNASRYLPPPKSDSSSLLSSSYSPSDLRRTPPVDTPPAAHPEIQTVSHTPAIATAQPESKMATLTLDGRTYRIHLAEELQTVPANHAQSLRQDSVMHAVGEPQQLRVAQPEPIAQPEPAPVVELNLPTALSMVGGQHPAVGFAQWRVQEAYARLDQAQILWLPSIQAGFSFHNHDGNYQASDGSIVDVHRSSLQYGLGAGATGAGTTPNPGVVARFHLADAIFQPKIAQTTAWARGHAANGVVNTQMLRVATAYMELLSAEQDLRIIEESADRTADLARLTSDFAAAGQGLQADADRMQTQLILLRGRLASARERNAVASARLSQALSIGADQRIIPLDPTVVPIELVSLEMDKPTLIQTGLGNRPELKESQALVAAACEQHRRQRYAPFVPSMLLGFTTGGFGGGLGNSVDNVNNRYDFDAQLTWEVRNLGFGEQSARRETAARVQQAKYEKIRVMDQVAREVAEAHSQVVHRAERISLTQQAIQSAEDSFERNLSRIREGQGLPLEVLQSVQALEESRRAYLTAVIDYNQAQFRLQWALGWPVGEGSSSPFAPRK